MAPTTRRAPARRATSGQSPGRAKKTQKTAARGRGAPRTGLTRAERFAQTHERIITASAIAFDRGGYLGVNLSLVLRDDLGMTKGALYDHFPDGKDELVAAIIDAHNNAVDQLYNESVAVEYDPLAALVRWTRAMARAMQADPIARAGSRLAIERNLIADLDIIDPYTDWTRRAAKLLRRAAAEGLLREGIDTAAVARALTGSFFGIQQMSMALKDRRDLLDRLDEYWDLLLPGLRPTRRHR